MSGGFQEIWEDLRSHSKHINRYPYDVVVSFIMRYHPKNKPRDSINVLDIGCGTGNNLWFIAKEGFNAFGIEGSQTAVNIANKLLKELGLSAYITLGDFTEELPYNSDFFDLVVDRGSICCVAKEKAMATVKEVYRVLRPGGYFLFTPPSKKHSSYIAKRGGNAYIIPSYSRLTEVGLICFYDEGDIYDILYKNDWEFVRLEECRCIDKLYNDLEAGWRVIVQKVKNR